MSDSSVGILCGTPADRTRMDEAGVILSKFGVTFEQQVLSAFRTPDAVAHYAAEAETRGLQVLIAGERRAAHLPGALAAHSVLPVIGVPLSAAPFGGSDALYAIVQTPRGVPVATVGVDGAANAAVLAVQILATADARLRGELYRFKQQLAEGLRL